MPLPDFGRGGRGGRYGNGAAYPSPNAFTSWGDGSYLIDALDDLQDDAAQGRYNPLIYVTGCGMDRSAEKIGTD